MSAPRKRRAAKKRPGPKAETLRVEGDWKDAVAAALKRGKPPASKPQKKGRK